MQRVISRHVKDIGKFGGAVGVNARLRTRRESRFY